MTLYQIKPAFQALLRPLMFWLYKKGVTANHVTLAAMALSFVTGIVLVTFPNLRFLFSCQSYCLSEWRLMRSMACWRVNVTNNRALGLF
ncbi:inner membrane protein ynbA [Shigella flexneri 1235-66]|nr:inner membrane protein ynbA [Shigella flexneri 1235-66]